MRYGEKGIERLIAKAAPRDFTAPKSKVASSAMTPELPSQGWISGNKKLHRPGRDSDESGGRACGLGLGSRVRTKMERIQTDKRKS